MRGGCFIVIYVDVLFVINFFITYLLLLLTSKLNKQGIKQRRALAASAVGGVYALVILLDIRDVFLSLAGKLTASLIIVLVAFGFAGIAGFLRNIAVFYFSNLLVLGAVAAVCFTLNPKGVKLSGGIVYFDISAAALLLSALFAYIISVVIIRLYNRIIAKREIFVITVYKNGREYRLSAFLDSGNRLREPFSDLPVIIADKSRIDLPAERVIPCSTVSGRGVLPAFRPDRIVISNGKNSLTTDRVFVALSDLGTGEFSAILNPEIINV